MLAKFPLQGQRTCLTCAAAGNDASVVTSSVERQIIAVRIFMRQLFGDRRLNQICCAKFGQKMLRGRPDRIAKFYESIKPGYDSRRQGKGAIGFVRLNVRIDLRIDKESRAPTHFVSPPRHSGSAWTR